MKKVFVSVLFAALVLVGCSNDKSTTPSVSTTPATSTASTTSATPSPNYKNCKQVPGAIYRGEPGYKQELDRDNDGIACNK